MWALRIRAGPRLRRPAALAGEQLAHLAQLGRTQRLVEVPLVDVLVRPTAGAGQTEPLAVVVTVPFSTPTPAGWPSCPAGSWRYSG